MCSTMNITKQREIIKINLVCAHARADLEGEEMHKFRYEQKKGKMKL